MMNAMCKVAPNETIYPNTNTNRMLKTLIYPQYNISEWPGE